LGLASAQVKIVIKFNAKQNLTLTVGLSVTVTLTLSLTDNIISKSAIHNYNNKYIINNYKCIIININNDS